MIKPENIKNTFVWAYIAIGGSQVFELLFNYFLYLLVSPAEIGTYSWAAALIVFFNVAVDMGIEPILVRKFGQNEFSLLNALRTILLLRTPLIGAGVLVLTSVYAYGTLSFNAYLILLLVGAHVVFNMFDGVSRAWLRANSQQTATNLITCLQSALKLASIATLYYLALDSVFYVLIFLLLIRFLCSVLLLGYANNMQRSRLPSLGGDFHLFPVAGNLFRTGISVGGIALLTATQNRLDWLMISGLFSATTLASYSLANKLYEITQTIIGVSLTTLYPWLCHRDEHSEFHLFLLLRVIVFVGVLISVSGIYIAPWLIGWLFGNKYIGVELPTQLMMLSAGVIAVSGVFYQLALAKGFEKQLLAITVVTTTLQLVSNLYWIPKLGMAGGAVGMIVLQLATSGGLTFVMFKNKLISSAILIRIMAFVSLFIILAALMIYLKTFASFALPAVGITILVVGWRILFLPDERRYLATHFYGTGRAVKKTFFRN